MEEVSLCLMTGGHGLLEGVPGLAKTLLIRTLADALELEVMGEPVRISSGESSGLTSAVVVPPLKVRDFTFTSLSDVI